MHDGERRAPASRVDKRVYGPTNAEFPGYGVTNVLRPGESAVSAERSAVDQLVDTWRRGYVGNRLAAVETVRRPAVAII
jgi:hypothetical protein